VRGLPPCARHGGWGRWSGGHWSSGASTPASFWLLLPGFGLTQDFGAAAWSSRARLVFGVAVPSSPGYVGVFEAAIVLATGVVRRSPGTRRSPTPLTYHAVTFLPIILLGFFSLARTSIGWRDLRP